MFLKKEKQKISGVDDLLDYRVHVDDGVIMLSTGMLMTAWEVRGPDMDSMSMHEAWSMCAHLSKQLSLGTGWTIQADLIHDECQEYKPERVWPDAVSRLIEEERQGQFSYTGDYANFISRYYICLAYQIPQGSGNRSQDWFFEETGGEKTGRMERELDAFKERISLVEQALRGTILAEKHTSIQRLKASVLGKRIYDDLCRYIRYCATGEDAPFVLPYEPVLLNQLLSPGDLTTGSTPKLDNKHIRVIAVDGFPDASFAGILREMDSIPFKFRFTQQAECMDEEEGTQLHLRNHSKWGMVKFTPLQALLKKDANAATVDPFAARLEADALEASSDAKHGLQHFVHYTAKVILMAETGEKLEQGTRLVKQVLRRAGFESRIESINATSAWLGSLPGHMRRDRRVSVASVSNLVHMMPLSAPFRGLEVNPSPFLPPKTPPLLYALANGRTPFRGHLHVEDVPDTFIGGPKGSGKTTLQALIVAQWFGLTGNARVYAFDKEQTLYVPTKCMGGDFYDLTAGGGGPKFCPLQHLETELDRAIAYSYMEMLCTLNGLEVNPAIRDDISKTITLLVERPSCRSISDFCNLAGGLNRRIKEALHFYTQDSVASGGILDGRSDGLSLNRFSAFEMGGLYKLDQKITTAVLFHCFNTIWRSLDPAIPTLVSVDETRALLDQPVAVKNFERFLVEGRKLNMATVLSIQEIGKIMDSPLRHTINQECQTKIFLANPNATTDQAEIYERFEMTPADREMIATGQPKADYYWTSPEGKQRVNLNMGQVALSFLASSGKEDREMLDYLMKKHPANFQSMWLRYRHRKMPQHGLDKWADRLDVLLAEYQARTVEEEYRESIAEEEQYQLAYA